MIDKLEKIKQIISEAEAILITAGAGMGVDSGLPDFRGNEGFWNAYPIAKKLNFQLTQVEFSVLHRWAPEVGAVHRFGKFEQAVDQTVFITRHTAHLRFKRVEGVAKGDEQQAQLVRHGPGHGAAQHKGFRVEAFLRRAFDV